MLAFKITINQEKIVYAGLNTGVVSVIFTYISRKDAQRKSDFSLHAGGLETVENYHIDWIKSLKIKKNDKILIEIVDVDKCSKIISKKINDALMDKKFKRNQLKTLAKEMGYKLIKV